MSPRAHAAPAEGTTLGGSRVASAVAKLLAGKQLSAKPTPSRLITVLTRTRPARHDPRRGDRRSRADRRGADLAPAATDRSGACRRADPRPDLGPAQRSCESRTIGLSSLAESEEPQSDHALPRNRRTGGGRSRRPRLRSRRPPGGARQAPPTAGRRLAERMRRERTDALNARAGRPPRRDAGLDRARRCPRWRGWPRRCGSGADDPRRAVGRTTFAALAVPNYRRYISGQAISLIGTWMQMTAQSWLVLTLTHSSTALGLIIALQTLPVLLLGPYGGVIADRIDKRRLMIALQAAMGVQALVLGLLTVTGAVQVMGDRRARRVARAQQRLRESVAPVLHARARRPRASAQRGQPQLGARQRRAFGRPGDRRHPDRHRRAPACASWSTRRASSPWSLRWRRWMAPALNPTTPTPRERGQLREGLRYVRSHRELAVPLVMMAVVGCLTYEFQVSLPVMASRGLHVGRHRVWLHDGRDGNRRRGRRSRRRRARHAPGCARWSSPLPPSAPRWPWPRSRPTWPSSWSPWRSPARASIAFMSTGNSTLQLTAAPEMRGRVMSLWFVAFQGSTPIGGPIVGWVMAVSGPRAGLGLGAVTAALVALGGRPCAALRAVAPLPGHGRLSATGGAGAGTGPYCQRVIGAALDTALDLSVVGGYTRLGYRLRRPLFNAGDLTSLKGRTVLVTGATSGLGLAAAEGFAALGADLWLLARDRERGEDRRGGDRRAGAGRGAPGDLRSGRAGLGPRLRRRASRPRCRRAARAGQQRGRDDRRSASCRPMASSSRSRSTWWPASSSPSVCSSALRAASPAPGRVINVSSGGMYAPAPARRRPAVRAG